MIFSNFLSDEIFWPAGPFFGSGVVVSQNLIPIGLQGTLYEPLACWETIVKPLKIRKSNLETFGLCLFFWPLWPFGSNSLNRLNSYGETVHISQKNHKILINGAVALAMAFENVFGLFYFSWGPWYLRSPVVCKNHVCE